MTNIKHSILVLFVLLSAFVSGQTEAEMKVQADKLFENEQYLEATPLYLRLLSLQPRDANYNYRYGTCLLYNSNNKPDAIKYLSYCINDPAIAPEAFYFLGKALHYNYQFNEAIKHYSTYNEKKASAVKKFDADREIQMCQNGKRLMTTISDLIVVDKKEIQSDKFFRIYDLHDIGGSMLVTAEFQSKTDKKYNHIPLIHFPQNPSVIYYSSYGENEATGKDIYVRRRLPDGSWGQPQPLPGNVNTKYDEDYPYMHPDGNYLYFSSKGHNSMGGYDVFRSKFDPETNSFGPPENMDFAISSPDDDLFYIVDSLNKNAYFASARQSQDGKLYVYKVKVDRVPLQLSVVKGNFKSDVDPSIKRIDFEIKDYSNGENIGKFNSNEKAVYLITFPKGGKYEYIMKVEGSPNEFRSIVSIPFLKEFKPLKQKIIHTIEEGREVVKIIDLFNEDVEDPQAVIAEVIKMRSDLNINVQEFDMDQLEKDKKNQEMLKELGFEDLILVEVSNALKDEVKRAKENKGDIDKINNNINSLVVQNTDDFNRLEEQIKSKVADASKVENDENKYILLREADQLIKKQNELKESSKNLLKLSDSINLVAKNSPTSGKIDQLNSVAEQFDKLYREGKEDEAIAYLQANKELIRNALNDRSTELKQNLVNQVVKIDDDFKGLSVKIDAYNKDIKQAELEIQALENSRYSVKKKELEALDAKINSKKEEIEMIRAERIKLEKKVDVLNNQKFLLNKQIAVLEVALSNPSGSSVSREVALKAAKETEKTNSNTLNAYVQQQIEELEKKDPTLRERIIVSSGMKGDNIMSEHRTLKQRIEDTPAISKDEKLKRLVTNSVSTKRALESRLSDVEAQLANNKFDQALNKEKQQILKDLELIQSEIDRYEQELNAGQSTDIASNEEKIIDEIDPEYEDKLTAIKNNPSLSERERLDQEQAVDQRFVTDLDQQIAENEERIRREPTNEQLKKRQETLRSIKENKQQQIQQRNEVIASTENPSSKVLTTDQARAKVDPQYIERRTAIENDKSKPEIERFNEIQKLDKALIPSIDNRIKEIDKLLKNSPNDKSLVEERAALVKLKTDTEKDISAREDSIASLQKGSNTQTDVIAKVDPEYETRVNKIQNNPSLSDKDKLEQLIKEDEQLKRTIDSAIEEKNDQIAKDTSNQGLKEELSQLNKVKEEVNVRIDDQKEQLQALNSGVSQKTSTELISEIAPDYTEKVDRIKSDRSIGEGDKLKALLKEDNDLLNEINDRIAKTELQLKKDPNNDVLKKELALLKELQTETIDRIKNQNADLARIENNQASGSSKEMIAKVDPGYDQRTEEIKKDDALSEKEKLEKLQREDKGLIQNIEEQIESIEQKDPDGNDKDLQKEMDQLKELKKSVESNIETRQNAIENTSDSKETEMLISEISPEYQKEIDAIKNNQKLTEQEKLSRTQIKDQELLEAIDKGIAENELKLKNNPDDRASQQKKDDLNALKSVVESRIEERDQLIENQAIGELTDQQFEQKKSDILNDVDPGYQKKKSGLINQETPDSYKELIALEEKTLVKLDAEKKSVQKILSKDPMNKDAILRLKLLESLIRDVEAEKSKWQEKLSGKPALSISEEDKKDLLNEIDPQFLSKRLDENQLRNADENQLSDQFNLEQELLSDIAARIEADKKVLEEDPGNKALEKELQILELLKKEAEERIKLIDTLLKDTSVASRSFTNAELNEKIDVIDPEYDQKEQAILNNNSLTNVEQLEELNALDRTLLNSVIDAISEVEEKLQNDPKNKSLLEEKALLEELASMVEKRISERESKIATEKTGSPLATGLKEEFIDQLDPNYRQDVKFIEENKSFDLLKKLELIQQKDLSLLSKVEKRLEAIAKIPEPKLVEIRNEQIALTELRDKLLQRTTERNAEINKLKSADSTEVLSKEDLVNNLVPGFETNRQEIQNDPGLNEDMKRDMLVQLEEALQQKAENRLAELESQLENDPSNTKLKNEIATLNEILSESRSRADDLKKGTSVTSASKEKIVSELMPDYESRQATLAESKMEESKKIDEQIKLENELLTKLKSELKAIDKLLDKDQGNSDLIIKRKLIVDLIKDQEARISDLNDQKKKAADQLVADNAVKAVDKTFEQDLEKIKTTQNNEAVNDALADREKQHQDLLTKEIESNEKALEKKADPKLQTVNDALKEELVESKSREEQYRKGNTQELENKEKEIAYLDNLREDLLSSKKDELTADYSTVQELKAQDEVLAQYESDLKKQITGVKNEMKTEPDNQELKQELEWLTGELETVQKKRRQINIEVGELETELIADNESQEVTSPELQKLQKEESQLETKLNDQNLTPTERKQVEKALEENRSEQITTENDLLETKVQEQDKNIEEQLTTLKQAEKTNPTEELKIAEKQASAELKEVDQLTKQAEETKNPEEKNYLLSEAATKQQTAEEIVETALYENELDKIEKEYGLTSLNTPEELHKKKRRYSVEIGELTSEIDALNEEWKNASKKDQPAILEQKNEKEKERKLLQDQLADVEQQLANVKEEEPILDPASEKVVLSYNEERDIASTKEYADYVEKVNESIKVEQQIINLESQLDQAKAQTKALVAENLKNPSPENKAAVEASATKVKQLEEELAVSKTELTQKRGSAEAVLPENTDEAMKMQNLVRRGIAPISKIAVAAALVPMPANGLEINTTGPGTYSETNRIPVNVTNPTGLVYRVQIGAFAKPIEQNKFKEFNPVSGETLNNGITRYMAGYFNNSNRVLQAMNQIRQLGYADAFPVAYCDGKRISLAEARRLEATGECVPKGENELLVEMAANTAVTMGLEDTTKLKKVQEFDYNKAPGAAKAEAIEARKGLFFTVQIGVYNKPVSSATLFNLEPYMTLRLPNGQIRYSTGIYHSVDEARPRKQEAINRGVKDAFITAYFNGERIPINDALAMLAERGAGILEPKEKPAAGTVTPQNTGTVTNPAVVSTSTEKPLEIPERKKVYYQIVSKKSFTEFPTDVLNRYNSHGSFYFDDADGKVKSSISDDQDDLPQVYYFRDDVDTLKFLSTNEFAGGNVLSLTFAEGKLPGDVVDYLLRLNFRKEYLQSEEGVNLLIHGVPEEKYEEINKELSVFGMSFTIITPKEEE